MESRYRVTVKKRNQIKAMKVIISTTYSDTYLFFLPITTFLWNKLGVDVICFMPKAEYEGVNVPPKLGLVLSQITIDKNRGFCNCYEFDAPENKQATYAQCSRLYGACLGLPENEVLVMGDVDMAVFKLPFLMNAETGLDDLPFIEVLGVDLVPENQLPICYIKGTVKNIRERFDINGRTYQQCLDDLLGHIEAEHFRGNYWGKDQEESFNKISKGYYAARNRARPGTQFASNRIDRDDAYFMDRLNPDILDYHMHRPGHTDENFEKILSVIKYFYPDDDLTWMKEYQTEYKKLL